MTASDREALNFEAVQRLIEIVQAHPEIVERTARLLAAEPTETTLVALQNRGQHESTPRKTRLRERRRQAGMQNYLIWLTPAGQAAMQALRHAGETTDAFFNRVLVTLQALSESSPVASPVSPAHREDAGDDHHPEVSPLQRKASLLKRLRDMKAQKLSLQAIANELNREGVPTISGKGQWQKGTIGNLLAEAENA
jgi:hypothetical protein